MARRRMLEMSSSSSSVDSDSDGEAKQKKKLKKNKKGKGAKPTFRCPLADEDEKRPDEEMFVLDTEEAEEGGEETSPQENVKKIPEVIIDKDIQKVLEKAAVQPGFEKNYAEASEGISRREAKRRRRAERERTKGSQWFDMPATELTPETRQDLEVLQMRAALDPTTHYRKNDRDVLPRYFQIGKVVDSPTDFYSSRLTRKERKKTIVDELLADSEFQTRSRKKYEELKAREARTKKGAFQKAGFKKRKDRPLKRARK